ncbi:MAG: hypothetical protein AAF559_13190 [Pseudomonadota bacterium]
MPYIPWYFLAAPLLAISASSAALEQPQGFAWGISPDEVMEALGEGAKRVDEADARKLEGQPELISQTDTYQGTPVIAQYHFRDGERLSVVRFYITKAADCPNFLANARTSLGKPEHSETQEIGGLMKIKSEDYPQAEKGMWVDLVEYAHVDPARAKCHITYRPFADGKPGAF